MISLDYIGLALDCIGLVIELAILYYVYMEWKAESEANKIFAAVLEMLSYERNKKKVRNMLRRLEK